MFCAFCFRITAKETFPLKMNNYIETLSIGLHNIYMSIVPCIIIIMNVSVFDHNLLFILIAADNELFVTLVQGTANHTLFP